MKRGRRGEPELRKWDYSGRDIEKAGPYYVHKTFSVGIFQWVFTVHYDSFRQYGLKRGKVICRVKGLASEPEMVYELAEKLCQDLEGGIPPMWRSQTAERRAK